MSDPPTTIAAEPAPEAPPSVAITDLPRKTYTLTSKSTDGFQQTVTLKIGPAILSTDTARLSSEWAASGGSGQVPCMDVNLPNDGSTAYILKSDMAAYAFGELTFTNDVPAFKAQDWEVSFFRHDEGNSGLGVGFSDGSRCDGLITGFRLSPSWDDGVRVWGPVPVVLAMADVRSPAHPLGDNEAVSHPLIMNFQDKTAEAQITLAKS